MIEQPSGGCGDALVEGDTHLALGNDTGSHVQNDRPCSGGNAQAKRIGPDPSGSATRWRHRTAEAVVVDGGDKGKASESCPLCILSEPTDMTTLAQRAG